MLNSDLSLEFLRVVEEAAIACAHTMGQGDGEQHQHGERHRRSHGPGRGRARRWQPRPHYLRYGGSSTRRGLSWR